MWDFWTLRPESLHQVMFLFSDRGTPDGFRHMNGEFLKKKENPGFFIFRLRLPHLQIGQPTRKSGLLQVPCQGRTRTPSLNLIIFLITDSSGYKEPDFWTSPAIGLRGSGKPPIIFSPLIFVQDYAIRDLYNAISTGNFPQWDFFIQVLINLKNILFFAMHFLRPFPFQVMTFEQAAHFRWNPFDLTKVWPHSNFPLIPGKNLSIYAHSDLNWNLVKTDKS